MDKSNLFGSYMCNTNNKKVENFKEEDGLRNFIFAILSIGLFSFLKIVLRFLLI